MPDDTADHFFFLFPDQIKVNHMGPVIEEVRGGHLLWGGSVAVSQDVKSLVSLLFPEVSTHGK